MLRATIPIEAATPLRLTECRPATFCCQSSRCARRDRALVDRRARPVDGTALHVGVFCPLFVDARGVALEITS